MGTLLNIASDFGDGVVDDFNKVSTLAVNIGPEFKQFGDAAKPLPIIGQAVSGMQSAYHLGCSGYDFATMDRDGGVAHLAQAATNAAMVVPGVNEAAGTMDKVLGYGGTGARIVSELAGVNPDKVDAIPTGLDDIMAGAAVGGVQAVLGKEDKTNNSGNRADEIGSGMGMMGAMMNVGGGLPGMIVGATANATTGLMIGDLLSPNESTSGTDGHYWQDLLW